MREPPLVSVLISNYNYGQFLEESIRSAVEQTYRPLEVIVVDDGSTDDSRVIIESFGDQVQPIFKENGGQASAFNAGFAATSGEIVCFLDADDVFALDKVADVVQEWEGDRRAGLIYHQVQPIDTEGRPAGKPWPRHVWRGSIRHRIERTGGSYPRPPTSGLSFTRSYLKHLFPIPTEHFRLGSGPHGEIYADSYIADPAAWVAPVLGIRRPLSFYRLHDENMSGIGRLDSAPERWLYATSRAAGTIAEFELMRRVLRDRFGIEARASLDDHLFLTLLYRGLREVSQTTALGVVWRSASLRRREKPRELLRVLLDRGFARRV